MKLTAIRRTDEEAFTPMQAEFRAPGGTIGRGRENRLVLADRPGALCLVQAMVRVSDTSCWLVNLSSMASVSINGDLLACDQEVVLRHGDEVAIGAYVLHAEHAGPAPAAGSDSGVIPGSGSGAGLGNTPSADDAGATAMNIVDDLIGASTLPAGPVPDVPAHSFDMTSAAARNSQGPLAQLNDVPIAHTLGQQDTAGASSTGRDNVRAQAGNMRPPTVRKG